MIQIQFEATRVAGEEDLSSGSDKRNQPGKQHRIITLDGERVGLHALGIREGRWITDDDVIGFANVKGPAGVAGTLMVTGGADGFFCWTTVALS